MGGGIKEEFVKSGFHYVTCKNCGCLYVNPRPPISQFEIFYSNSKSSKFFAEKYIKPYTEARREKIFIPRVNDIVEKFSRIKNGKIGDIGAGTGIFLEELHKTWDTAQLVAIEPSTEMAKICKEKQLTVISKMLEDVTLDDIHGKGFDLLCSFELFEHLYNPEDFLKKIHSLLSENGYLYLTTLNGKGFDIQLLWERHNNVNPPHHINFANPDSMCVILKNCGFEVISIETPGKLDWDIVEQRITSEKYDLGRLFNTICEADDKTKTSLQDWISNNNLSSHMRVIAQKVIEK